MSYDILFVPRRPGQPWDEALDEAEERDALTVPVGPERLQQWERVVAVLRRRTGEVEVFVDDEALEATCASGLQVSLFPDEAALSFPYQEREDPAAFHDLVVDLVGLVEAETGLSAWDAQTDEPFDGRVHDEQGPAAGRDPGPQAHGGVDTDASAGVDRSGAVGPGTGAVSVTDETTTTGSGQSAEASQSTGAGQSVGESQSTGASQVSEAGLATGASQAAGAGPSAGEPATTSRDGAPGLALADQRRRALRYLVLGAVIVVVSLLLREQEDPSLLSGLALAVGVADLVIGGLMYRSYLRRANAAR